MTVTPPAELTTLSERIVPMLPQAVTLYGLLAEHADMVSRTNNVEETGRYSTGDVSDPTLGRVLSEACKPCKGVGRLERLTDCPLCLGRYNVDDCRGCRGSGKVGERCEHCKGTGWEPTEEQLDLRALADFARMLQSIPGVVKRLADRAPVMFNNIRVIDERERNQAAKVLAAAYLGKKVRNDPAAKEAVLAPYDVRDGHLAALEEQVKEQLFCELCGSGPYVRLKRRLCSTCTSRWEAAYSNTGIDVVTWIVREKAGRSRDTVAAQG